MGNILQLFEDSIKGFYLTDVSESNKVTMILALAVLTDGDVHEDEIIKGHEIIYEHFKNTVGAPEEEITCICNEFMGKIKEYKRDKRLLREDKKILKRIMFSSESEDRIYKEFAEKIFSADGILEENELKLINKNKETK